MMHSQNTPFRFSPRNGSRWVCEPMTAARYRDKFPHYAWEYNPWTGTARLGSDIADDPCGLLIRPEGEVLLAAKPPPPIERALATQAEKHPTMSAVLRFLDDLCHPEQYGHAVSKEVRMRARQLANAVCRQADEMTRWPGTIECSSCNGTGSGEGVGCTDCLGTGRVPDVYGVEGKKT